MTRPLIVRAGACFWFLPFPALLLLLLLLVFLFFNCNHCAQLGRNRALTASSILLLLQTSRHRPPCLRACISCSSCNSACILASFWWCPPASCSQLGLPCTTWCLSLAPEKRDRIRATPVSTSLDVISLRMHVAIKRKKTRRRKKECLADQGSLLSSRLVCRLGCESRLCSASFLHSTNQLTSSFLFPSLPSFGCPLRPFFFFLFCNCLLSLSRSLESPSL